LIDTIVGRRPTLIDDNSSDYTEFHPSPRHYVYLVRPLNLYAAYSISMVCAHYFSVCGNVNTLCAHYILWCRYYIYLVHNL